jgi:hypothetical protein
MIVKSLGKNDNNKFVSSFVNFTPGNLYNGKREYLLFLKTVILLVAAYAVVELLNDQIHGLIHFDKVTVISV